MTKELDLLVRTARATVMSAQDREKQRRSFAYGNTAFENKDITREMVDREAERIARDERDEPRDDRR